MLIAYLPLIVCIIGVLLYALATNVKVSAIGKDMFWTGLLVTLFSTASHTVHLF